jgi:pectinesterase inhibitor-like protein
MNSISCFFFVLLLTLWSYQILATIEVETPTPTTAKATAEPKGSDLIAKTCERTLYKDLCKASLYSITNSNQADLHGLAGLALKLAARNATNISKDITNLLNKNSDPVMQQCLSDCSENYIDAIDQIRDSLAALDSKGYNDANTWVTAAMSDADSCEQGFDDQGAQESPLKANSTTFSQLCSNALAIINLLAGK